MRRLVGTHLSPMIHRSFSELSLRLCFAGVNRAISMSAHCTNSYSANLLNVMLNRSNQCRNGLWRTTEITINLEERET